jgi:hypothetical protein
MFFYAGTTKFRPRVPDAYVPIKEGDEFSGIEHNDDLQVALHEWPMLYGEMLLVLMVVVFLSPLLIGPAILFLLVTKAMRFSTGFLSAIGAQRSGHYED